MLGTYKGACDRPLCARDLQPGERRRYLLYRWCFLLWHKACASDLAGVRGSITQDALAHLNGASGVCVGSSPAAYTMTVPEERWLTGLRQQRSCSVACEFFAGDNDENAAFRRTRHHSWGKALVSSWTLPLLYMRIMEMGTTSSAEETIIVYVELRSRDLHKDSPEVLEEPTRSPSLCSSARSLQLPKWGSHKGMMRAEKTEIMVRAEATATDLSFGRRVSPLSLSTYQSKAVFRFSWLKDFHLERHQNTDPALRRWGYLYSFHHMCVWEIQMLPRSRVLV